MILIVGATGILGGMITQKLLAEGKDVRVLVRHDSPAEAMALQGLATSPQVLIEAGAEPVYGDLKDPPSLIEACEGIRTLVTTANSAMRSGDDNVETVDRRGQSQPDRGSPGGRCQAVHIYLISRRRFESPGAHLPG